MTPLTRRTWQVLTTPSVIVTLAVLPLTGTTAACNCTLIGCMSSLTVQLDPPPTTPYRVEAWTTTDEPRHVATCPEPGVCAGRAVFVDYLPTQVTMDIITGVDTVRRNVAGPIRYTPHYPNGEHCGSACSTAVVTVQR